MSRVNLNELFSELFSPELNEKIDTVEGEIVDGDEDIPSSIAWDHDGLLCLVTIFIERFDLDDLDELMFRLKIHIDNIKGSSLKGKALRLVKYLDHRRAIPKLIVVGKKQRPDIDWDACVTYLES